MLRACVVWLVMILVGGAAVAGCSDAATEARPGLQPSAIVFASDSLRVKEGDSARIVGRVVDATGHDIPDATVQFSTGDDTTIGLSADGLLHGVHPGGAHVMATSGSMHAELTVDVMGHPEGILVGTLSLSSRPFGAAVSRDGVVYVTRLDADSLAITDVASRQLNGGIAVGSVPTGVAFDPTGKVAYVTNQFSGNVGIIDVDGHSQVDSIGITGNPFVVVASPDGSKMYVTSNTPGCSRSIPRPTPSSIPSRWGARRTASRWPPATRLSTSARRSAAPSPRSTCAPMPCCAPSTSAALHRT